VSKVIVQIPCIKEIMTMMMMIIIIIITIGATTISETFRQYLSNRPGKHEIKEL
jgi:hypothetical protein